MAEPGEDRTQSIEPLLDLGVRAAALEAAIAASPRGFGTSFLIIQAAKAFEAYLIGYDDMTPIFDGPARES